MNTAEVYNLIDAILNMPSVGQSRFPVDSAHSCMERLGYRYITCNRDTAIYETRKKYALLEQGVVHFYKRP